MPDLLNLKQNDTVAVKFLNPVNNKSEILADLQLEYGRFPVLELHNDTVSVDMRKVDLIEVTSIKSGSARKYSLISLEDNGVESICKYVYTGKADINNLHKVSFSIPELAPYFSNELSYKLDKDVNLTGSLKIEPMEAIVLLESQSLTIKVHQNYELKQFENKNGFGFTNRMCISFESNRNLSFDDIENMMYKATKLFTWVTGFPVTVDKVDVFDNHHSGHLYIPSLVHNQKYDTSYPKSFMSHSIFRKNYKTICHHYFGVNSTTFDDIWSRTIPLFDFSGVLEYELMLFASVLDKYFSMKVKELSLEKKLKQEEYTAFISRLHSNLLNDSELCSLVTDEALTDYITLSSLNKAIPNTSLNTFNKKAKTFLRHIGKDCTDIFINDSELFDIKSIRDRAAHGEFEKFPTTKTIKLLWKLKTLTMYLIYRDLGISDDIFLKSFSTTLHPIRLNCNFNHFKLDYKIGRATVIRLDKKNLEEFQNYTRSNHVFWLRGDQWIFDKSLSSAVTNYFTDPSKPYFKDGGYRSHHEYVQAEVDRTAPSFKAKFCSHAYLVTKQKETSLHSVTIIEKQKTFEDT